ncbi:hypothetical protein CBP31_11565 [Oceanisphaera profunda]|uniref:Uncharacterized protein n=1 Tax=Oceanisphaera profunda TaxID=1416627 RepID=A0A1Y0D6K3_9GAMM|nr:hypothetical protein [Oceanisphaera profunda]ART83171.1 hypothetical protein CBP31_11565 [Oceanisphaera profunda]
MRLLHLFGTSAVKKPHSLLVLALCTMLSGCFAPMLAMGPSQLMWAFIKPFVGLDPSSSQLFEKPMIKNRMTALLGEDYEETLALLRTAPALKQEGTLFYLASPTEDGEAQAAGLVWNAQTNKMSAIVNDGKETKLFNEPNSTVPVVWPKTLQPLVAPTKNGAIKAAFSGQSATAVELTETEQQLKAAQAQLKALQDQADLQAVQAKIKALQNQTTLEASNKAAVKAKVKTDVDTDVKTEVKTKVQLKNKAGLNIETTTATKKVNAQ